MKFVHENTRVVAKEVAARYGINLVDSAAAARTDPDWSWLNGRAFSARHRAVACSEFVPAEILLHELVHVICQPPFAAADNIPENWLVLPFEDRLAIKVARKVPRHQDRFLLDVDAYMFGGGSRGIRMDGGVPTWIFLGGEDADTPTWEAGVALARHLGLLSSSNEPTWNWPDWSRTSLTALESFSGGDDPGHGL